MRIRTGQHRLQRMLVGQEHLASFFKKRRQLDRRVLSQDQRLRHILVEKDFHWAPAIQNELILQRSPNRLLGDAGILLDDLLDRHSCREPL